MSLGDRVYRLERLLREVAPNAPCPICGYPDPDAPGWAVVDSIQEIPECPRCGQKVDEEGRCLAVVGPEGKPRVKFWIVPNLVLPTWGDVMNRQGGADLTGE